MAKKIKMKLNKEFAIQTAQYKALSEKIDELMCLKLSYLLRTQLLHIFSHYLDYSYIMMEGFIKSLPSSNTQNFEQLKLRSCFAYASGFYSVARVCISIIQEFFIGLTLVLSETDELYKKIQQHRKKNRPNIRGIIETRDFISAHPFDLKRSSRTIGFGHSVNPGGILGIQMFDSTEWLTISDKDIETYLNNNKKKIDPQKDLKEFFEYCTESLNLLHEVWAEYRMENWAKNMGKQFKE